MSQIQLEIDGYRHHAGEFYNKTVLSSCSCPRCKGSLVHAGPSKAWSARCDGNPPIDVKGMAAVVLMDRRNELRNFKLATVAEAHGINMDDGKTHDPMFDIRLAREMFQLILDRLNERRVNT